MQVFFLVSLSAFVSNGQEVRGKVKSLRFRDFFLLNKFIGKSQICIDEWTRYIFWFCIYSSYHSRRKNVEFVVNLLDWHQFDGENCRWHCAWTIRAHRSYWWHSSLDHSVVSPANSEGISATPTAAFSVSIEERKRKKNKYFSINSNEFNFSGNNWKL